MKAIPYTVYNREGKILRSGYCQNGLVGAQRGEGEYVIWGQADDLAQFVHEGKLVPKLSMDVTVDKTLARADGLDACMVRGNIDGAEFSVTLDDEKFSEGVIHGGEIKFTSIEVGEIVLSLSKFPYRGVTITMEFSNAYSSR